MSLSFLIIYIFGIFLLLVCSIENEQNIYTIRVRNRKIVQMSISERTILLLLVIIATSLMCATRSMDSYDTAVYVPWYNKIQNIPLFQRDGTYGILFELFAKVVAKILNSNYQVFFFFIALFNLVFVYNAILNDVKQKEMVYFSYLLYLVFIGFYYSFIVLRQGLAITMVITAYSVLDKSKKKALLLCLLGIFFHESALVAFVCILLFYNTAISFKKHTLFFLLMLSLIFYLTHCTTVFVAPILQMALNMLNKIDEFTFHKYILYFGEEALSYDISILYVLYHLITGVILYFFHAKTKELGIDKKEHFFLTINVLGVSIIGFFAAAGTITRLAEYLTTCTYIFLIPNCLNKIMNIKGTKLVIAILMIMMTVLQIRIILGATNIFL